jgi:hypothetical protein
MSVLSYTWIVSALLCALLLLYARFLLSRLGVSKEIGAHNNLRDIIALEIVALRDDGARFVRFMTPHGKRSLSLGARVCRRGHDVFMRRVYGRIHLEKGRASSFFLKQIVEHKELDTMRDDPLRGV